MARAKGQCQFAARNGGSWNRRSRRNGSTNRSLPALIPECILTRLSIDHDPESCEVRSIPMRALLASALSAFGLAVVNCSTVPPQDPDGVLRVTLNTLGPIYWAYPDLDSVKLLTPDGGSLKPELDFEHTRAILFRTTGTGPFTLLIDDPRFERVELKDLAPSESRVDARLVGRSVIRPRVFEGSDGSSIKSWTASLRLENSSYPSAEEPWDVATIWSKSNPSAEHARMDCFELPGEDMPQLPDGGFYGIAPGDYTLIVKAEGHGTIFVACSGLAVGEQREIEVPMWPSCSVTGFVDGVPPSLECVGSIEVFAFAPGEESAPPPGMTFGHPWTPDHYRGFRLERATCEVSADGSFRLDGLAPGTYLIQARQHCVQRNLADSRFVLAKSLSSAVALTPGQDASTVVRWKPN